MEKKLKCCLLQFLFGALRFNIICSDLANAGDFIPSLRHDFTSNLLHGLAFGTPKFYIAPFMVA